MPSPVVSLGPFDLLEPIARGGMAQVWRAVHREQGVPVAIKVVTGAAAERAEFDRRFGDEVRAVAALDHPGVVMVLDHGRIGPETRHPKLAPGSPWLAMEWASGGTLANRRGPMPWPMQKAVILALLDALAHAHAHGVVHRDLKPPNVLVATKQDARPGIKLSDFGIAFAGRGLKLEEGDLVVGTPSYMAPEQIRGDWRDFGPWTDLYALGCLAWWLCTGHPPFSGNRPQAIMVSHLTGELPAFEPRIPVPNGFEGWLRRLLEKRIERRFQLASDAAWALSCLGLPPIALGDDIPELDAAFQDTITHTDVSFGESWRLLVEDRAGQPDDLAGKPAVLPENPPMPDTWRRPLPKPPPMQLVGAGLSLYGLRAVQLAGREAERDLLWSELAQVAATGRARVVLIHGPAGTGKSRLVEWICRRAHELGAATWCKATFAPEKAPGQALQEMGVDYLNTWGLGRPDVERRVRRFLHRHGSDDDAEAEVLTELLCPATPDDVADGVRPVRLTRPREFYTGTSNTMYRLAARRPLIGWLDDVQYGLHGLGLALEVLRTQDLRPFPCLLLLSMRNEALDDQSDEARRLAKLMDTPGATALPLGPLPPGSHRELVRGLLGLDEALAARVEERTGGNPLFAVQLVGSWVQDGTLVVGEGGFRLVADARADLPDDLHAVWAAHVTRVVREFSFPNAQEFLEIAACLGQEVHRDEWRRACDDPHGLFGDRFAGDEPSRAQLVERLLVHRLIVGTRSRWSFVHGMLRESLERTARQAGRWRGHHEACAAMLAGRAEDPRVAERLGRHLLEAGAIEAALRPLLTGVEHRLVTVGAQPARALLSTVAGAMREVPEADPRWGRLWTLSARIHQELGELEPALVEARRAGQAAQQHGWPEIAFTATKTEARLLLRLRRLPDAEKLLAELEDDALRRRDPARLGAALAGLAEVSRRKGEPEQAIEQLTRAIAALALAAERDPGDTSLLAQLAEAHLDQGRVATSLGRSDAAVAALERALRGFEQLGSGLGAAECHDRLGRDAFERGDLPRAETLLGRALSQYEALGSERQLSCRMRLARVMVRTDPGPVGAARTWAVVERVQPQIARLDHRGRVAAGYALKLVRHALDRDWAAWDEVFVEASGHPPHVGAAVGAAWLTWLAGEAALLGGAPDRAGLALAVAAALFRAAGDPGLEAEVRSSDRR